MSFLEDFGQQAASQGLDILTAWGRNELGIPTTTSPETPAAPAQPAGQPAANVVATSPYTEPVATTNANFYVFGVPVNKTAALVGGSALLVVVFVKVLR